MIWKQLELTSSIIISLATISSTWCVFQSSRWTGIQAIDAMKANQASRTADTMEIQSLQERQIDVAIFLRYLDALRVNDKKSILFFDKRMPPRLRVAVEAWSKQHPLKNPTTPLTPFFMPEYQVAEDQKRIDSLNSAQELFQEVRTSNRNSDMYVLLTVIFTSVLFFCGTAPKANPAPIQKLLMMLGSIFFLGALVTLILLPIAP